MIFSKASSGRFPLDNEVEEIFEAIRDGKEPPPVPEPQKKSGVIASILDRLRN